MLYLENEFPIFIRYTVRRLRQERQLEPGVPYISDKIGNDY